MADDVSEVDEDFQDEVEEKQQTPHPRVGPLPFVDRTQEFNDYALAMAEIKGADLQDLSEALGVGLDVLTRRLGKPAYKQVRQKVAQSRMAASVCRVKLAERQVDLVEQMILIGLGLLRPTKEQNQMLLGLKDVLIPSNLQQAVTTLANSGARVNSQLATSMSEHVKTIRELAPPKRTIETPILEGDAALPIAARLKPDDNGD